MAIIPGTKYAQGAPSESTGQVLMSPPAEGGGMKIAAGIEKMGAVITAYAINAQKQEMSADYYEKKRLMDEAGWAAHNAIMGDEEADNKVWEKFQADAQVISQSSKYEDVNNLLAEHLNKVSPNWEQGMFVQSLTIRKNNAEYQSIFEADKMLEMGDVEGAVDIYKKTKLLNPGKAAKYDKLISDARGNSHLLIAEKLIAQNETEAALAELKKTEKMNLTTEQLETVNDLRYKIEAGSAELKKQQEKNYKGYMQQIWTDKLSDPDIVRGAWIGGEISKPQLDDLEKEMMNPADETNSAAYSIVDDAILDYGSGRKTREDVEKVFEENKNKINKDDKLTLSKKLSSERDKFLDNQQRTGHKIISNILFSSIGGSIYDPVTDEIDWGKLIAGGKATAEEIAAYHRGTILFNSWMDSLTDQKKTPSDKDIIFQALQIGNQVQKEISTGKISPTLEGMKEHPIAGAKAALAAAAAIAVSPPKQVIPTITTSEEFTKLPRGSTFIYKGQKRIKN